MGTMVTMKPADVKQFIRDQLNCQREDGYTQAVLDVAIVNLSEAYAAVEIQAPGAAPQVECSIWKLSFNKSRFDDYDFSYKVFSERSGTGFTNCPQRILDRLTPIDDPYALEWRAECQANLDRRKMLRGITPGTVIVFDRPVYFGGQAERVFSYLGKSRYWKGEALQRINPFTAESRGPCKVTKWRGQDGLRLYPATDLQEVCARVAREDSLEAAWRAILKRPAPIPDVMRGSFRRRLVQDAAGSSYPRSDLAQVFHHLGAGHHEGFDRADEVLRDLAVAAGQPAEEALRYKPTEDQLTRVFDDLLGDPDVIDSVMRKDRRCEDVARWLARRQVAPPDSLELGLEAPAPLAAMAP